MKNQARQKTKAPPVAAVGALKTEQSASDSNAMSSRSEAQRQRILAALRRRPQTTEDLRQIGIFQAATRVKELRDRFHYNIETVRVTVVDRESYSHPRAALYVLHEQRGG